MVGVAPAAPTRARRRQQALALVDAQASAGAHPRARPRPRSRRALASSAPSELLRFVLLCSNSVARGSSAKTAAERLDRLALRRRSARSGTTTSTVTSRSPLRLASLPVGRHRRRAAHAHHLAARRSRRDAHRDLAVERRHLHVGAERGFGERDRQPHREVVAAAPEERVRRARARPRRGRRAGRRSRRRAPRPFTRMRCPSATPAGIRTFTSRGAHLDAAAVAGRARRRDRPGRARRTWGTPARTRTGPGRPRSIRCRGTAGTSRAIVPGAAPDPVARRARSRRRGSAPCVVTPRTASSNDRCSSVSRSWPRCGPLRGRAAPRRPRPPNRLPKMPPRVAEPAVPRSRTSDLVPPARPKPPGPNPPKPPGPTPDATIWRTSSYSLRFSASPSTSYAAEISLKRSSAAVLPGVGVGVILLRELLVGARELLLGRARRHAEHGVVVLLEPLALCCQRRVLPRTTFTIAGRSTRPFNLQPVRNTSPTCGSPSPSSCMHRFVLVRVERRALARRCARGRPARAHRRNSA